MKRFVMVLSALCLLCSCESELANTAISQDAKIDSFIQSKYADSTVVYQNGVNRILLAAGDSTAFAASGDKVNFSYVAYPFNSSIDSNPFAAGEYTAVLGSGEIIKGLEYGIEGMCPGERSYIVFSCKYAYGATVAGVGSDKALAFEVVLNAINPEDE